MDSVTSPLSENQEQPKTAPFNWLPFFNTTQAKFVLFLLAVIFYTPSIDNEYALDDGIVIHQNSAVLEGVSGIKEIISHDTYHSFYKRMNASDQLSGGRYRPLPEISYALEQEILGSYRTGFYMFVEDLNRNGILDDDKVTYTNGNKELQSSYEYNAFIDVNNDGHAAPEECYNCWDTNVNFANDAEEDLNVDGVFNEVDCQVRGAGLRHFTNILLYALVCLMLYQLLSVYFFTDKQDLAFVSAFIFTIHPVHSEVVANVRGRDDLLSLLFIIICLIQAFNYVDRGKAKHLLLCAAAAFLALFSKEYGLVLFIVLPLSLYYFRGGSASAKQSILPLFITLIIAASMFACDLKGKYFFQNQWLNFGTIAAAALVLTALYLGMSAKEKRGRFVGAAFGLSAIAYLVFRLSSVSTSVSINDQELLNNPYLFATGEEALATKIFINFNNIKLFLWPHILVSDYSYNAVPYLSFKDLSVWLSLAIQLGLLIIGIALTVRKHIVGYALLFFFLFALPSSNLLFYTQLMYLESFLFHASVGLSIATAFLLIEGIKLISSKTQLKAKPVLSLLLLVILVPCVSKSWERCKDWKNDITLFLKDVKNTPNSVLVLGNAGARWIDLADTREITGVSIPGQDTTRFNDYNGTLVITDEEMLEGHYSDKRSAALNKGINYLLRAAELHPRYVNGFLNLGLAYYKLGDYDKATYFWKYAETLYPNNPYLRNYYAVFGNQLFQTGKSLFENDKNYKQALIEFSRLSIITPKDAEVYSYMSKCFEALGEPGKAAYYKTKAEKLQVPDALKSLPATKNPC